MKQLTIILLTFLTIGLITSCKKVDVQKETKKGIRQYNADSLNSAIRTLTKVISETDTCSDCYQYRAFAYKDLKEYEKALRDFNSFIQLDTTEAIGYANRGSIYYLKRDYKNALFDFKYALKLDSSFTVMYNTISHMLYATGQKDEACKYYYKAIAIGDTNFNETIVEYCDK